MRLRNGTATLLIRLRIVLVVMGAVTAPLHQAGRMNHKTARARHAVRYHNIGNRFFQDMGNTCTIFPRKGEDHGLEGVQYVGAADSIHRSG